MCRAHRAGEAISAHAVDAPSRSVFRAAGAALPKGDLYAAQAVEDEAGQLAFEVALQDRDVTTGITPPSIARVATRAGPK